MPERVVEIAVVGAGLAGLAAAVRLHHLGREVALIDTPGRSPVGVTSLAPTVRPLLGLLGARAHFDAAGFAPIATVEVAWAGESVLQPGAGWVAAAGALGAVLAGVAEDVGLTRLSGAPPATPAPDGWILDCADGPCRAGAVVAAIPGVLPGQRQEPLGPATSARCHTANRGGVDARAHVRVWTHDTGWTWQADTPDGRRHVVAVGDTTGPGAIVDVTPRRAVDPLGPRHAVVGAACLALDPLSSQGVQRTLAGALQAATALHTVLDRPADVDLARSFYVGRLDAAVAEHRRHVHERYRRAAEHHGTSFWIARQGRPTPLTPPARGEVPIGAALRSAPDLRVEPAPRLDHDRVRWGPALHHPTLDGPIAFLGDRELAPLLAALDDAGSLRALLASVPVREQVAVAAAVDWLWRGGLIVADHAAVASRAPP